jgi:hypothetical protein
VVEAWFHCLIDLAGTAYWTGKGFDPDPASGRIVRFRSKKAAQHEVAPVSPSRHQRQVL